MQTWFRSSPRKEKNRHGKRRQPQQSRRARFDASLFAVERLEDRVLLAADLGLDKTVTPTGTVLPGELLTYTITASNPTGNGVTPATGVVVTDALPAGETLVSSTVSTTGTGTPTISNSGNTVTATLGTLNPGDSDTITIQALVTTTAAGTLTNSASMTNTSGDTPPADATASNTVLTLPAIGTVDLSVTKTAATSPATVGTAEVYTVVVKNNEAAGGTTATGVTLVDNLPANATGYSSSAGTISGNVLTDSIATLAPGASATVTVSVTPTAGGVLVNTAAVSGTEPDSNPANNVATTVTPVGGGVATGTVDLSVTKTAATNPATVGANEVYTVVVRNNSPATDATGVTLVDTLPANATFVSATGPGGALTPTGNVLTDSIGALPAATSATVTVTVTPTTAGAVVNTAVVAGDQVDTNLANNTATTVTPVGSGTGTGTVDLSVTKTATTNPATVGTPEVYTIVVKNNNATGGTGATGVTLVDTLPANASNYTSSAGTISGNVLTDSIGALTAGASATVTVSVTPTAAGVLANTAVVAGDQIDNNPLNNTATTVTAVGGGVTTGTVDLSVTKTAATNPATAGSNEVYTIVVKNNNAAGGTGGTGVTLVDTLPANATFVSATDSTGNTPTVTAGVLTDSIGSLAAGATDTISVTMAVGATATGVLVNSATVAGNEVDTDLLNNTAATTTPVTGSVTTGTVDLSVTKTAGTNPAVAGSNEVYTIVVKNNNAAGGTAASGVTLVDTLPISSDFVPISATDSTGATPTITGNVLTDDIGSLAAGATDTISVTMGVPSNASGALVNTATVAGNEVDTNLTNNTAATTTPISGSVTTGTVDLSVTKTAGTNPATAGSNEVYTILVKNNNAAGGTGATGVTLVDTLPANATFVGATDSTGTTPTVTAGVLTDSIGSLTAGATDTISVTMAVGATATGVLVNAATVAGNEVDTNLTNNAATTTTPISGSVTNATVDLSVTKTAGTNPATAGSNEVYTILVKNNNAAGGTGGTGVTLVDTLPANATFVGATDSTGTTPNVTAGVLTDSIGSLAAGATDTISVTMAVGTTATGVLVNAATVAGNEVDNNLTNNAATTTTPISGSVTTGTVDLSVTKTAGTNPAVAGTNEVYTIVVKNNNASGGTGGTGVTLVDTLPANATFVSATDSTGTTPTVTAGVLTDNIGSLAAGATDTINVTMAVGATATGVLVNTATVAGNEVDNNGANNTAATTTPITGSVTTGTVDLSVTKTAGTNPAIAGSNEVYTIVVTNNNASGGTGSTGVTLIDTLPANATFVSATDSTGTTPTVASGVLTDNIGNLAAGATDTISVTMAVGASATGTLVNTATVAGNEFDTNLTNNTATTTTTISTTATQANVSITKTGPANGTVGTNLTYTITVTNATGAASAAGVTVTDTLPTGLTFVSGTDSSGGTISSSGSTVTDNVGTLAAGATDTITIVATPGASIAGTSVTNSASVTTTTTNIGTPTTATATTAIGTTTTGPTLNITKSADATGTVGQNLTYTIVVSNTGTSAATGTTFTDTLPAGLTFVSATDSLGGTVTNTGGTLSESLGSLAAGATDTITVIVTPGSSLAGQSITNTASASSPDFNGGVAVTASATTSFTGTTPTGHICFLAGVPGDGTINTFITNLYRELLGREPDAPSVPFWTTYLQAHNNAAGRMQVTESFMNSPEYKAHYITCVYENLLGRAPDAGGLQFWTQKMGNPGTPGQNTGSADERYIVAAFLGSDEFYINSGNTPQSWINAVYEDVFGRAADGQGAAFWMNELQTRGAADRDGIMRDLLIQPEAAHLLLDSFYPAAGGTTSNPLAAPGTEAGTGSTPLAQLTGGGWENLYLEGPYGNNAEANDGFFASLAAGGNWNDVQLLILDSDQFYTNPNRPVTA